MNAAAPRQTDVVPQTLAHRFGTALPANVARRDGYARLDSCDVILVTATLYRPSELRHGAVGRLLEAQGFRVGIISQPDWHSADDLRAPGQAQPVLRA